LYLEEMTNPLTLVCNTRTLSISETPSTLPLDKHPVGLVDPEDLVDPVDLEIPLGDQTTQEPYPPLISFPYNPQET